jgi:AraC-like DNA-binding protein
MKRLNESRIVGVIEDAFAVRASTGTTSTLHAQHGAGIFVNLESDVVVTDPTGAQIRGRVVVLPPHLVHSLVSPGASLGLLYDPEEMPHMGAHAGLRGGAYVPDAALTARILDMAVAHRACLFEPGVLSGLAAEVASLFPRDRARPIDARVARVLGALRDVRADRRLAVAGAGVCPAHLQALFARDVGLPIRTFHLWHRLLAALRAFATLEVTTDATTAAHAAGFADLAHFSRTCRRMLGYSPTLLRDGAPPP